MSRRPEILAPAGDPAALQAALSAGADAVYFGLDEGFNARARAKNFPLAELAATVAKIHRHGARAYLAVNTLVFEPELPHAERVLRGAAEAGVDALIVQDPAIALLARALCPQLEVHASTQMTICNADAAAFAQGLGVTRVVLPREFSVAEIRRFTEGTSLEVEVFVHGALCVSWSGQCLTSEAWGGRSANRGQCAQSCRMPYDLIVDGEHRPLGDVKYLLSPKDQAAFRALPELTALGVSSLKIEGRQKGPQYVATAVAGYRRQVDALAGGAPQRTEDAKDALRAMALSYSRGFSDGFFAGSDHQQLVEGRFPKHRGIYAGRVVAVLPRERTVVVARDGEKRPWTGALAQDGARQGPRGALSSPLDGDLDVLDLEIEPRPGMGVVFDRGQPEAKDEPGGPIFGVDEVPDGVRLRFGTPGPDLARVAAGDRVWISGDPALAGTVADGGEAHGRVALALTVRGARGEPLRVRAEVCSGPSAGVVAEAATASALDAARGAGLDAALLREKLAFGGTPFRVDALDADALARGLHLPVSELKTLRRALAEELLPRVERGAARTVAATPALALPDTAPLAQAAPQLVPLVRTDAQLDAVLDAKLPEVELDWMELAGLSAAVARARHAGLRVTVATLRVTKPGEDAFDERIAKLDPDAVLVRNFGALVRFARMRAGGRPTLHGDFALNVTNSITARHLLGLGLDTVTASFDLDESQLASLVAAVPKGCVAVAAFHRMPAFHTEHCVYAHLLSAGRDFRSCGRPCERHKVSLRDHLGHEHAVIVDAGCRNTVFDATALTPARQVPALLKAGVRRFRVELVRESAHETRAILAAFAGLLAGRRTPQELLAALPVEARVGVSRNRMEVTA